MSSKKKIDLALHQKATKDVQIASSNSRSNAVVPSNSSSKTTSSSNPSDTTPAPPAPAPVTPAPATPVPDSYLNHDIKIMVEMFKPHLSYSKQALIKNLETFLYLFAANKWWRPGGCHLKVLEEDLKADIQSLLVSLPNDPKWQDLLFSYLHPTIPINVNKPFQWPLGFPAYVAKQMMKLQELKRFMIKQRREMVKFGNEYWKELSGTGEPCRPITLETLQAILNKISVMLQQKMKVPSKETRYPNWWLFFIFCGIIREKEEDRLRIGVDEGRGDNPKKTDKPKKGAEGGEGEEELEESEKEDDDNGEIEVVTGKVQEVKDLLDTDKYDKEKNRKETMQEEEGSNEKKKRPDQKKKQQEKEKKEDEGKPSTPSTSKATSSVPMVVDEPTVEEKKVTSAVNPPVASPSLISSQKKATTVSSSVSKKRKAETVPNLINSNSSSNGVGAFPNKKPSLPVYQPPNYSAVFPRSAVVPAAASEIPKAITSAASPQSSVRTSSLPLPSETQLQKQTELMKDLETLVAKLKQLIEKTKLKIVDIHQLDAMDPQLPAIIERNRELQEDIEEWELEIEDYEFEIVGLLRNKVNRSKGTFLPKREK